MKFFDVSIFFLRSVSNIQLTSEGRKETLPIAFASNIDIVHLLLDRRAPVRLYRLLGFQRSNPGSQMR